MEFCLQTLHIARKLIIVSIKLTVRVIWRWTIMFHCHKRLIIDHFSGISGVERSAFSQNQLYAQLRL